jgi:hypothetical protein
VFDMRVAGQRTRHAATLVTVMVGLLGSGALVWQASYAAFTAKTVTGSNSLASGTVTITNDQSSQVVLNVSGMHPDSALSALTPPSGGAYTAAGTDSGGSACVKVTYSGSVKANVRMYATLGGDTAGLGAWTLLTVDTAAGNTTDPTGCGSFPAGSTYVYGTSGTTTSQLGSFPTSYAAPGAAATEWVASPGQVRWYRLCWLMPSTISQLATTAKNITATFTWEAASA